METLIEVLLAFTVGVIVGAIGIIVLIRDAKGDF